MNNTVPVVEVEWLKSAMEAMALNPGRVPPNYVDAVRDAIAKEQPNIVAFCEVASERSVEEYLDALSEQEQDNIKEWLLYSLLLPWKALYDQIKHSQ